MSETKAAWTGGLAGPNFDLEYFWSEDGEESMAVIGGHFTLEEIWKMFPDHKADDEPIRGIESYGYVRWEYYSEDMDQYDEKLSKKDNAGWILHPGTLPTLPVNWKLPGVTRKATILDIGDD